MTTTQSVSSAVLTAIVCAGVVTAQFVGGKAARDALFLDHVGIDSLPAMVMVTAVFSILLVAVNAKGVSRMSPARFVPWAFTISAILLIGEWLLTFASPRLASVLVYLHVSGLGPILGSGFWLVASERFDPRTAKRSYAQIAGGGTFGGLLGGLLAERVAVTLGVGAMLPVLAVLNLICAWQVARLVPALPQAKASEEYLPDLMPESAWSGLRVLAERPYLRHLALLVLLGTTSAALMDYVFKVQAAAALGTGESLLRFFALYYAGTSLVTFAVQASMSQFALERFGLAFASATPSLSLILGSAGALVAPGFESSLVARGAESVLRGSVFRSGYEVFYTPVPAGEKRAAKSIIDVGFDRAGDAVGGAAIRAALLLSPSMQYTALVSMTLLCSGAAILVATRLTRGYVSTLERSLRDRAVELDLDRVDDLTTRTAMLRTLSGAEAGGISLAASASNSVDDPAPLALPTGVDPELQEIMWLRSRDSDHVIAVLRQEEELTPALLPHVIPLLAWDAVAEDAIVALRRVAAAHVGTLSDALLDPNEEFAVRRRVARVMAVCGSQRAVDSLVLGLDDQRFEVRLQCGRSLAYIIERRPDLRIDPVRIFDVVRREVAVGRPVWEGRQLLDRLDDGETPSFVDEFVRARANKSLAHVFTVLSLVLAAEPLQIAFRGLHADDQNLRGTALEYLESVLPVAIREPLWPFLEDSRAVRAGRPREDVLADLLRSNHSIMLNLEEMKRRAEEAAERG